MDPFSRRDRLLLSGVFGLFAVLLIVYSQTWAYTGDEGFHLLAAMLVRRGMRPWIDFCFPQAPLIAYWNAGWMWLAGETWRVSHAVSAVLVAAAVALLAAFVARQFPLERAWRLGAAMAAGLFAGLNAQVFAFGPLGQAYGLCLFLLVAAFLLAVRETTGAAAGAGFLASAAAASSLLAAPAAPVLLLWMAWQRQWKRAAAFCAAAVAPWLPAVWLAVQGPRQAWFNLIEYQTRFRQLYWPETTRHDLEVMTSWIDSGQTLLLGALAIGGLAWVARQSQWPRAVKSHLYLCGWLALAICVALGFGHPTFPRYFLLAAPFAAIPAAAGLYAAGSRIFPSPAWPLAAVLFITGCGLGEALYARRGNYTWSDYERIGRRVLSVTPPGGAIFAEEIVYFAMHRPPARGLEFYYDRKVNLPPSELALLHILPQAEVERRLSAGAFATVYLCEDEDTYDRLGLPKLYRHQDAIEDCALFWGRR